MRRRLKESAEFGSLKTEQIIGRNNKHNSKEKKKEELERTIQFIK